MSSVVLVTAGYDHSIRFWEATTGVCVRTIPHNESQVNKLEISADKVLLAAAGNPLIKIYDVPSQSNQPISTFEGHTGNVTSIGFQKDKRWMYSGTHARVPAPPPSHAHAPRAQAARTARSGSGTCAAAGVSVSTSHARL